MLLYLILALQFYHMMCAKFEFTSIKCTVHDTSYADVEYCFVKAINRSYRYISTKANLHKPLTDFWTNVDVRKRANGYEYKPFLYNITVDLCKFLKFRSKNLLYNYFYSFIASYTNMNHTCPFNHSLLLEKFSTDRVLFSIRDLPVPSGEYGVFTTWMYGKVAFVSINVFGKLY